MIAGRPAVKHNREPNGQKTVDTETLSGNWWKGGEYPVRQWPCALVQQGLGKVVEGALAASAPVAFTPRSVVVLAPGIDLVTVAPGTLEGAILPPQGVDVRLPLLGAEELVDRGEKRHDEKSPGS
jgi:hypothetical protein